MKQKYESFSMFSQSKTYVERYFNKSIKNFHLGASGEYISNKFQMYLQKFEIMHQFISFYTSKQNGVVEHKYHHLLEMT